MTQECVCVFPVLLECFGFRLSTVSSVSSISTQFFAHLRCQSIFVFSKKYEEGRTSCVLFDAQDAG